MSLSSYLELVVTILSLHLKRLRYVYGAGVLLVLFFGVFVWWLVLRAPTGFPLNTVITVAPGESVGQVAHDLKDLHAIESVTLFKIAVRLSFDEHGIQAGKYVFHQPQGVFGVVYRLTHGISGIPTTRLTFPEGTPARQMGMLLAKALPGFDEQKFDSIAIPHEGYLFPDTYFFLADTSPDDALKILSDNFTAHERDLDQRAEASGHSTREIVTMASLLEGEGKTETDKRTIAGILWKRITLKMPLQVDATFGYDYGKTGYTPTPADLVSNSAYNTYRYRGLPPTPINNPGTESIDAALHPLASPYLYYLTGSDGQMHYAKTFAEHLVNKKKYLK